MNEAIRLLHEELKRTKDGFDKAIMRRDEVEKALAAWQREHTQAKAALELIERLAERSRMPGVADT